MPRTVLACPASFVRSILSPAAWRRLLARIRLRRRVRASGLVDAEWYRREYPEVAETGTDPVRDFLAHVRSRVPNPDFVPDEYASANHDVKASGIPPAVHYVLHGMREERPTSFLETAARPFPDGAVELRREFAAAPPVRRRTAVFASFSGDGRIKDAVLHYLRGLRKVVDDVAFVANNPVFPDEVAKLDGLVRLAVFRNHGGYDFGSYKIGWNEAKTLGLLDPAVCDELVVCNDSCYGPVFPFAEMFAEMERRDADRPAEERTDFWGTSSMRLCGRFAVQSFFYAFRRRVLDGPELGRWFEELVPPHDRGLVVVRCESVLTDILVRAGYRADSFVPFSFFERVRITPTKRPLSLLRDWRMPLVKAKALAGDSLEDLDDARAFLRSANPELAALVPPAPPRRERPFETSRRARERHSAAMDGTAAALAAARAAGRPVRILFLALAADPFPGGEAFSALRGDPAFRVSAAVVPDLRIADPKRRGAAAREAREALAARFPDAEVRLAEADDCGEFPDLAADADIVAYGTAENASDFRYDPHWAVGRAFLPVLLFDRRAAGPYPLEKEFARQNYAYFRKVVFADREAFDLYAKHSIRKGENAVLAEDGAAAAAMAP